MNLRLYPMDIQVCPLIIESCEYNVHTNTSIQIVFFSFLVNWHLEGKLHKWQILNNRQPSQRARKRHLVHIFKGDLENSFGGLDISAPSVYIQQNAYF